VGVVAAADTRAEEATAAFHRALALEPDNSTAHHEPALLQLKKHRLGNPAGLAQAADGFAAALRADPHAGMSRRNLDLVLHVLLGRTACAIFIVAILTGQTLSFQRRRSSPFCYGAAARVPIPDRRPVCVRTSARAARPSDATSAYSIHRLRGRLRFSRSSRISGRRCRRPAGERDCFQFCGRLRITCSLDPAAADQAGIPPKTTHSNVTSVPLGLATAIGC
jgi:hypothetical protein